MIICFHSGKLGVKPDSLTRCWDVYPKEGDKDYAQVNTHNFHPILTSEQLASSIQASTLAFPVLHAAVLMDVEQLHKNILSTLPNDPIGSTCMSNPLDCRKFPKLVVIRNRLHCVTITITNNVVILMVGFQAVAIRLIQCLN